MGAGPPGTEPDHIRTTADDPLEEAQRTMEEHQVRRLPVIDGHRLVGMVSQGDLAKALPDARTGALVEAISED